MKKYAYIKTPEVVIGDWEISFDAMFQSILDRHVKPGSIVYDAGCGRGRLFKWVISKAKVIYAKELDEYRFKAAEKEAKKIDGANIKVINGSICETDDLIGIGAAIGTVDLVVCSHVFQHVPFSVCQQAIKAFHTMLRPGGKLILMVSKNPSGRMTHSKSVGEEFAPEIEIDLNEYQRIFHEGVPDCLPIRMFTFPLMEDILHNPYSKALTELFKNESDPDNDSAEKNYFKVIDWKADESKVENGSYIDYDNFKKDYPETFRQVFGSNSVEYTPENRIKIENAINSYSHLKHQYLWDMTVIAEKIG